MPTPGNLVLSKMLDRLLAGVMSGPNMNCRPARSRQRVDLTHLARLGDKSPVQVLHDLLGAEESCKLVAKIKAPKKSAEHPARPGIQQAPAESFEHVPESLPADSPESRHEQSPMDPSESGAHRSDYLFVDEPNESKQTPYAAQSALLAKLRVIADDAKTYENDTGVAALNVGFPLLSVPPAPAGPGQRPGRRILAPIAFVPVTLVVKAGAKPSVEIGCRGDGADRVRPNEALLAWIEQQTGVAAPPEAEAAVDPWTEICGLVKHVAAAMHLEVPSEFTAPSPSPGDPGEGRGEGDLETPVVRAEPNHPHPDPLAGGRPIRSLLPDDREREPEETSNKFDTHDLPAKPVLRDSEEPGSAATTAHDPALRNTSETRLKELAEAPRPDDDTAEPAIVTAAVLGLFPTAHQGLIRDTRALLDHPDTIGDGPIRPFLTAGVDFDAPVNPVDLSTPAPAMKPKGAALLAAAADPCQAAAVALARDSSALVVHGPPGTGKSQTITNIIADHLARGERVLLVCEKRTALDVVADRLDHLGLRQLCGIVHDPQRDQRDLYKSVKQQLDELADAKTDPEAGKKLQKIEADIAAVHGELSAYFSAVSGTVDGISFHDLVGTWLAADGDQPVSAGESVAAVPVAELAANRIGLVDLFKRAESVGFSRNPWAKCAGISLADFLTRPMAEWRTVLERIAAAAVAADVARAETIPPFNARASVLDQAEARGQLADRLEANWPRVQRMESTGVWSAMATEKTPPVEPGPTRNADVALVRSTPIQPALATRLAMPPNDAESEQTRAALTEYVRSAEKWTAAFAFKAKSAATAALSPYGLPLSVDGANRVLAFLDGVGARKRLSVLRLNVLGEPPPSTAWALASDPVLLDFNDALDDWLDLIFGALSAPATSSIAVGVIERKLSAADLLDGLRKSMARAEAISSLHELLVESKLFGADWVANVWGELLNGGAVAETIASLVDRLEALEGVLRVRAARAGLPAATGAVVDALLTRVVSPEQAVGLMERTSVETEIRRRLAANPMLVNVDDHRIASLFDQYRSLQERRRDAVRETIRHRWIGRQQARLLNEQKSKRNSLATALSGRLITRGQRATRLREVIARGANTPDGDPLFDLRPVWMASPETAAQIFPLKAIFDVVVFDEASQCRLEEALPVLTRGKRVVVAGDPHQLPPTRFFESAVVQSDDQEPETDQELFEHQQGQIEDLLAAALNLSIMQSHLDVHYRSRYADLIQFSNEHFYRKRLQPLPAHPSRRPAVSPVLMVRVAGVYQRRCNEAEAVKVVEIVRGLLDQADPPSIGIACLNLPQRDLIVEKLEEAAAEDAEFGKKLAAARARRGTGSSDGLFVKNLENVQGDERDDIIISTTYGPDPAGKFHRRFGPVGMAGGGRRLNVLVTRARCRVHLVTSIPTGEYASLPPVPDGSAPTGAWLLFAYLQYADRLTAEYAVPAVAAAPATGPADGSALVKGLAARLQKRLSVVAPWGSDGFGLDLAVTAVAPAGRPAVGILCDAPRSPGAVDVIEWDAFRTGVLTGAGWSVVRVWSPHFYRDPRGHVARLVEAAERAEIRN
jgi:hypothetical protein